VASILSEPIGKRLMGEYRLYGGTILVTACVSPAGMRGDIPGTSASCASTGVNRS
jgi:hypothetical protein